MKKNTSPFRLTSSSGPISIRSSTATRSEVTLHSEVSQNVIDDKLLVDQIKKAKDKQDLVKYIEEDVELSKQLTEAGNKLVLLAFLFLGVQPSENMLNGLVNKVKGYESSVVILAVDVAKMGEIAKKYEATQIPWFTFIKKNNILEAYHSIDTDRLGLSIEKHLGLEQNTLRTFIKDGEDLKKRLTETENKLVILAFLIPDDEAGQRLCIELDEIDEREDAVEIIKVDVDLCEEIATKYHIQGVPTLVFMKDQTVVEQFMGNDTENIHRAIAQYKIQDKPTTDNEEHLPELVPSVAVEKPVIKEASKE